MEAWLTLPFWALLWVLAYGVLLLLALLGAAWRWVFCGAGLLLIATIEAVITSPRP